LKRPKEIKESVMATTEKTSRSDEGSGGFMGFVRDSFKNGMSAAEELQAAAVEVPLSMLKAVGVSEDDTQVLKDKNRQLVHGMVGSIQSFAGQLAEVGTKQVELAAEAIRKAAKDKEEKS